jgi:Domain of unknown function (DUF3291)
VAHHLAEVNVARMLAPLDDPLLRDFVAAVGPVERLAAAGAGFASRWFAPTPQPSTALWWVAAGSRPTLDDALRRLTLLRTYGPTPKAFSLRRRFDPQGRPVVRRNSRPDRAWTGSRTGRGR